MKSQEERSKIPMIIEDQEKGAEARPVLWDQVKQILSQWDIGSLPVVIGLIIIAIIFQIANPNFLTPLNLTNLMVQISAVGTIAVGVVLVLLIAEIDLSVGSVSGFTAAIMAVLSVKMGMPSLVAVGAGILTGVIIGLFQGFWIARLHVPSFVVTLAGYLGWQGALLYALGSTGTINLTDPWIVGIANTRLPVPLGWALGILFVLGYAVSAFQERRERRRIGMQLPSLSLVVGRLAVIGAGVLIAVGIMNANRSFTSVAIQGVPSAVLIFIGFIVLFDWVTRSTHFGRHVYAVGGNAEAARRAGINVDRIRITVFVLSSMMAACGGILAGSRLLAVNQSSGSGDVLLNSIAAAVIGGTSLFGGRGNVWSALLGALVIGSIANGMDLLALSSSIKFMVTGVVLLIAVTIDAYARARREAMGRT
jgi:D-xylose transport system permease protein